MLVYERLVYLIVKLLLCGSHDPCRSDNGPVQAAGRPLRSSTDQTLHTTRVRNRLWAVNTRRGRGEAHRLKVSMKNCVKEALKIEPVLVAVCCPNERRVGRTVRHSHSETQWCW